MKAGRYTATWDGRNDAGSNVVSGVYFYRFETQSYSSTKKMILMK
jgi:flagellar hook assembly protein FlgD